MTENKVGRRKVLASIGAGTIATGTGIVIGSGSDNGIEIVTDWAGDEPLHTEVVSEDWYTHVKAVREAQEVLKESVLGYEGVMSVGRTAVETEIDGLKKKKLEVQVKKEEVTSNIVSIIPDEVSGIDVEIKEISKENIHIDDHEDPGWCDEESVSCAEGGNILSCRYVNNHGDCKETWGTLTATGAVERHGEEYMMTSAHGFYHSDGYECSPDIRDQVAGQGNACNDGTELIGWVEHYDHSQDWALINTEHHQEISSGIVSENTMISGHVSEDGVDHLDSNDDEVYKYGARSCHSSGVVNNIYDGSRCSEEKWVSLTTNAGGGDSGAPHYRKIHTQRGTVISLIGHHTWHEDDDGEHISSRAPAAFGLHNKHDIEFKQISCY